MLSKNLAFVLNTKFTHEVLGLTMVLLFFQATVWPRLWDWLLWVEGLCRIEALGRKQRPQENKTFVGASSGGAPGVT